MDRIAQAVGHVDRNASEQAHFLDLGPGQQYGVRHDYVHDQVLSAVGPRLYSVIVFLDDAQSEGELWFPDLAVTITPKAGALVLFANVRRDDYLAPEPRMRHAHRALGDAVVQHVRALETWVHLFPFREPHTWTCIAPHGAYWSGEHDDEASELGHRRARLATLRKERAALADASGDCTDDAFLRRHFDFCGGRVMRVVKGGLAGNVIEPV